MPRAEGARLTQARKAGWGPLAESPGLTGVPGQERRKTSCQLGRVAAPPGRQPAHGHLALREVAVGVAWGLLSHDVIVGALTATAVKQLASGSAGKGGAVPAEQRDAELQNGPVGHLRDVMHRELGSLCRP
jgi:hypothetical protein